MAILYDVPEGKVLVIEGPCTATIKGAAGHPRLVDPDDIQLPEPPPETEPEAA